MRNFGPSCASFFAFCSAIVAVGGCGNGGTSAANGDAGGSCATTLSSWCADASGGLCPTLAAGQAQACAAGTANGSGTFQCGEYLEVYLYQGGEDQAVEYYYASPANQLVAVTDSMGPSLYECLAGSPPSGANGAPPVPAINPACVSIPCGERVRSPSILARSSGAEDAIP